MGEGASIRAAAPGPDPAFLASTTAEQGFREEFGEQQQPVAQKSTHLQQLVETQESSRSRRSEGVLTGNHACYQCTNGPEEGGADKGAGRRCAPC